MTKNRNMNLGWEGARVPQEEASAGRGKEKETGRRGGRIIESICCNFLDYARYTVQEVLSDFHLKTNTGWTYSLK